MDAEDNHVHLLVQYPPKVAVFSLVNSLKGVSSRLLRQQRPDIRERYWKGVLRSPSYFASSCGGAPISIMRQYFQRTNIPRFARLVMLCSTRGLRRLATSRCVDSRRSGCPQSDRRSNRLSSLDVIDP
jgi:putative transposase